MRSGPDLYAWLAGVSPHERDAAVEAMLGVDTRLSSGSPGPHLVGHHRSGVAAIVRAIHEVPIRADDLMVDLGAGVGKAGALVHLFTGARVRGVEIQRTLVDASIPIANVVHGDARTAALDGASVIFLYCPFEGPVLEAVSRRLDERDDLVVVALGVDLRCTRLRARPSADFWMTIWDSSAPRHALPMPALAQALAHERTDH